MRASVALRGISENGESIGAGNIDPATMAPLDAAYHTAHQYKGGVHALALSMGVSGNVLQNKVNPNNTTHHLTLAEAVAMMDLADNDAILMSMAAHRGYDLMQTIPVNTGNPVSLYWQAAAAQADFMQAASDALEHGATTNALRNARNRAVDAMAHMNNLLAALAATVPTAPKEVQQPRPPSMGKGHEMTQRNTSTRSPHGATPGFGSFRKERREGNSNPSRRVDSEAGSY
ncbi:MAG: hypothetical protein E6Q78_05200 [Rhodoferax sp.]|nr:MAG: hypothetical protein E6Q78_05200 [Rhodoferax sp.]